MCALRLVGKWAWHSRKSLNSDAVTIYRSKTILGRETNCCLCVMKALEMPQWPQRLEIHVVWEDNQKLHKFWMFHTLILLIYLFKVQDVHLDARQHTINQMKTNKEKEKHTANCCNGHKNGGRMILCAHANTGMLGMYSVAGVWGMPGLWKAAADSCHLACQDVTVSSPCPSLTHTRSTLSPLPFGFPSVCHVACLLLHAHALIPASTPECNFTPWTRLVLFSFFPFFPLCKQSLLLISGNILKASLIKSKVHSAASRATWADLVLSVFTSFQLKLSLQLKHCFSFSPLKTK